MDVYIPTHLDIYILSICMYLINDDSCWSWWSWWWPFSSDHCIDVDEEEEEEEDAAAAADDDDDDDEEE